MYILVLTMVLLKELIHTGFCSKYKPVGAASFIQLFINIPRPLRSRVMQHVTAGVCTYSMKSRMNSPWESTVVCVCVCVWVKGRTCLFKPVPQRKLDNSCLSGDGSNNGRLLPTKPSSSVGGVAVRGPRGACTPFPTLASTHSLSSL